MRAGRGPRFAIPAAAVGVTVALVVACAGRKPPAPSEPASGSSAGRPVALGLSASPTRALGADAGASDDAHVLSILSTARRKPRALLLAPRYAWTESGPDIGNVAAALVQAGIPFDRQAPGSDWQASLGALPRYAVAIVPGYLLGSVVTEDAVRAFEAFARDGGVVVVWKPAGSADHKRAWELTGLSLATRRRDVLEMRVAGVPSPLTADLDSPEERTVLVNPSRQPGKRAGVEVYVLTPLPGTASLAHAFGANEQPLGATITRREVGRGAVYAIGHDLATFGTARCYTNCFEPSGDLVRLVLEGALREATAGHSVVKHTVPGDAPSVLLVTHDVDTPDAFREGPWGPPGALQALEVARAHGVRPTFDVTTDIVSGAYERSAVEALCAKDECALGAHGVIHPRRFAELPKGTCDETAATYGHPGSLCGEIRVSLELLSVFTGQKPRVWRSPNLAVHPAQFEVLVESGVTVDSGFAVGDLPFNLPVDLAETGLLQDRFARRPLLEIPVACTDEMDATTGGRRVHVELGAGNADDFVTRWEHVTRENAKNRSFTTLLVHPGRGQDMPVDNLRVKMRALDRFLARAKAIGVATSTLETIADFWRFRRDTSLDVAYDDASRSYVGALVTPERTVPGLTLAFGEEVAAFTCASCGDVRVHGRHVVFVDALTPASRHVFHASPAKR